MQLLLHVIEQTESILSDNFPALEIKKTFKLLYSINICKMTASSTVSPMTKIFHAEAFEFFMSSGCEYVS